MISHIKEVAIEVVLKKVVPSLLAASVAIISSHASALSDWGVTINTQVFQKKAMPLVLTILLFVTHYAVHIFDKAKEGETK